VIAVTLFVVEVFLLALLLAALLLLLGVIPDVQAGSEVRVERTGTALYESGHLGLMVGDRFFSPRFFAAGRASSSSSSCSCSSSSSLGLSSDSS
jgi:K+-transporting ATPase c subunit